MDYHKVDIIERLCGSKTGRADDCEDRLVVAGGFVAAIDGATSLTGQQLFGRRHQFLRHQLGSLCLGQWGNHQHDGRYGHHRCQGRECRLCHQRGHHQCGRHHHRQHEERITRPALHGWRHHQCHECQHHHPQRDQFCGGYRSWLLWMLNRDRRLDAFIMVCFIVSQLASCLGIPLMSFRSISKCIYVKIQNRPCFFPLRLRG